MRIGFSGTHGVGKTTIANLVSKELDIPLLSEVARSISEQGFLIASKNSVTSTQAQLAIFGMQMLEEQRLYPNYVSDRTMLDALAYTDTLCSYDNILCNMYTSLENFVLEYVKNMYDIIFYVPIRFDVVDDGFRDISNYRDVVDDILQEILDKYLGKVVLIDGSSNEMLKKVLKEVI